MNTLPGITTTDPYWLTLVRRARELADQMETWNAPGLPYPTETDIMHWAGAAAGILRMVGGRDERPMPDEWVHETARGIEDYRPTDA